MKTKQANQDKIYILLTLLFFLVFFYLKFPTTSIPYFWDELGVYVTGMHEIVDNHTLGILPSDLEPLYSRGHPMLFYFVGASAFKLFGDSILVGHLLAIFIAIFTLIAFYKMSASIFNSRIAFIATFALAFQPIFFAMSGVLLPEMLLTLFFILSLWAITENRWVLYTISSSLAILTKESAILIPCIAWIILFIETILNKDLLSIKRWSKFLIATVPLLVYGAFLLIQKFQNGWYFFPEHIGLIHADLFALKHTGKRILIELFIDQGRWFLLIIAIIGFLFTKRNQFTVAQKKMLVLTSILIVSTTIFSSINYYLSRYNLFIYPFYILIAIVGFDQIHQKLSKGVSCISQFAFLIVISILSFLKMYAMDFSDTYDMSYTYTTECVQNCIQWTIKQPWKDSTINTNFPIQQAIEEHRNGYIPSDLKPLLPWGQKNQFNLEFYLGDDKPINQWNYDSIVKRFDNNFAHIVVFTDKQHK